MDSEFMEKQILHNKLRVLVARRIGEEPDPPNVDFAGVGAKTLDLLHIDFKIPSEHTGAFLLFGFFLLCTVEYMFIRFAFQFVFAHSVIIAFNLFQYVGADLMGKCRYVSFFFLFFFLNLILFVGLFFIPEYLITQIMCCKHLVYFGSIISFIQAGKVRFFIISLRLLSIQNQSNTI